MTSASVTNYTDQELEYLFLHPESDLVERKRTPGGRSAVHRTICAFANDLPGHGRPGVIFIGVNDDGSCADLKIDDDLLQTLAQMRSDGNTLPLPTMILETRTIPGCELVALIVTPALEPPVRYQGESG